MRHVSEEYVELQHLGLVIAVIEARVVLKNRHYVNVGCGDDLPGAAHYLYEFEYI